MDDVCCWVGLGRDGVGVGWARRRLGSAWLGSAWLEWDGLGWAGLGWDGMILDGLTGQEEIHVG